MTRLTRAALAALPEGVVRPGHDPATIRTGIIHFGPGAFHRAHQASYVDSLLDSDPRWGIAAVSLRSAGIADTLAAQDGLYSLTTLDRVTRIRVIAAHSAFVRPGEDAQVRRLLFDPKVRLLTSTVTEKGYCLAPDGTLDLSHPDIVHDLEDPAAPVSLVGWIVAGLAARRAAGTSPFAVLCCDNMNSNGDTLAAAAARFARQFDQGLADWITGEVAFPNTMVDSITPATDPAHLARVRGLLGLEDAAAVQREGFTQWVVEHFNLADGPDLASVGVQMTGDVAAYEKAKLRILNGAHSSIAYIGLALGHASVADAMGDQRFAAFIERLVHGDIIPSLAPAAGLDLSFYADTVLDRFRNPALRHLLGQIAWDGSQKLRYRLLGTTLDAKASGRPVTRLAVPVAAWMAFIRRMARSGEPIVDPLAPRLTDIGRAAGDAASLADTLLTLDLFPPLLVADETWRGAVRAALERIEGADPYSALA